MVTPAAARSKDGKVEKRKSYGKEKHFLECRSEAHASSCHGAKAREATPVNAQYELSKSNASPRQSVFSFEIKSGFLNIPQLYFLSGGAGGAGRCRGERLALIPVTSC